MFNPNRILPKGIQSFEEIRREGMLYVDKTDIVWNLAHFGKYNYLSRPRRFGKSLFVRTLACYFEGKRELFEGLKIMELETEWLSYPVIRLDLSGVESKAQSLRNYFKSTFADFEGKYGIETNDAEELNLRFKKIIWTAKEKTGLPVVILVDEYDAPLLHTWGTLEHDPCTDIYRSVFAALKSEDDYIKFVFITGITKFNHISLFSTLNNLTNISFEPEFASICGMTRDEISATFMPEIEAMAARNGWTVDEAMDQIKYHYDGYHFSPWNMVDVYNPFSVIVSLSKGRIVGAWVESGPTALLHKFVKDLDLKLESFDGCKVVGVVLESSDVADGGAPLFLYQSGYLTIKGYQAGVYTLGIPNNEVRESLFNVVIPSLTLKSNDIILTTQAALSLALSTADLDEAKRSLAALIADVPYSNVKLSSMHMEERYRFIISNIFQAIGLRVQVERMTANGRIDIVAQNEKYTYVIELKLSNAGGVDAAEKQIVDNHYADPFKGDHRNVIPMAMELDADGHGLVDWRRVDA